MLFMLYIYQVYLVFGSQYAASRMGIMETILKLKYSACQEEPRL